MILLIDCSKGLRLIIGNKQRIVANKSKPRLKKVSERLTVEIKILLNSIQKDYQNLSKIIVINGPGSFTGIRTGITAAKVLGLSLKLPVCGISLFELLPKFILIALALFVLISKFSPLPNPEWLLTPEVNSVFPPTL